MNLNIIFKANIFKPHLECGCHKLRREILPELNIHKYSKHPPTAILKIKYKNTWEIAKTSFNSLVFL